MARPEGKYAWTVTVGTKGQIVLPKEARDVFDIKPGDTLRVKCYAKYIRYSAYRIYSNGSRNRDYSFFIDQIPDPSQKEQKGRVYHQ